MRVIPLAEILTMDIGEIVPSTRGKISNVFGRKTGNNDHGDWSVQAVVLKKDKAELRVKLWNHPEIPKSWKGKELVIISATGTKGIKGLQVQQDDYNWKEGQPVKKLLEVKEDAEVGLDGAMPTGTPAAETPKPAEQPAKAPAQTAQAPAPAKTPSKTSLVSPDDRRNCIIRTKRFLMTRVNGYELVLRGAGHLAAKLQAAGTAITPEHFQAMCASLYISCERAGQFDELPPDDLDKYFPAK